MKETTEAKIRILLVEDQDEDAFLVERMLRRGTHGTAFEVDRARTLKEALGSVAASLPDLVLLDLSLPDSSDLEGLTYLTERFEAVPIVVLTGFQGHARALQAIEIGAQDYLHKDLMTPELLQRSIRYARERSRILGGTRQLLEKTLHGCIESLTAILAMDNPAAFGRAVRLKQHVSGLARILGLTPRWPVEVAAMVSHVGCVNLPDETCRKLYEGAALTDEELREVDRLPQMAESLLANIPGLEPVRQILKWQEELKSHQSSFLDRDRPSPAASVLFVANEYDVLESAKHSPEEALRILANNPHRFDPAVVRALEELRASAAAADDPIDCMPSEALVGMTLAEDVTTKEGRLLVSRGLAITNELAQRIRKFADGIGIRQPIRAYRRSQACLAK